VIVVCGRIFDDVIPSSSGDNEENLRKVPGLPVMQPIFEMVFFSKYDACVPTLFVGFYVNARLENKVINVNCVY
jgi:hypothetical protein